MHLVFGGHDHIMWKRNIHDRWVVKYRLDVKVICLFYFYFLRFCQPVKVVFKFFVVVVMYKTTVKEIAIEMMTSW